MVRADQQVRVQQLDLLLPIPELGQVSHLTAPPPFFAGNYAKSAASVTATGQESVGCAGKLQIKRIIRVLVLLHVRQVRPWAVAGAAPDDVVGVGDVDVVLGIGVGESPAFVDEIVPALRPPHLHGSAPSLVVSGQLHQAEVGPVVPVHVSAPDLQFILFPRTSPHSLVCLTLPGRVIPLRGWGKAIRRCLFGVLDCIHH